MRILVTIVILFVSSLAFAGGPWLLQKKGGFLQVQSTFPTGTYKRIFLENNQDLDLRREVWDVNLQGYLEYGLSDKFNLIAIVPLKYVATGAPTLQTFAADPDLLPEEQLLGFGNLQFRLKYRLSDKKVKAAVSLYSSLNNVDARLNAGLVTGYLASSIGLYGHVGGSLSDNWYTFLEAGYNVPDNGFSQFIEGNYELGHQVKKNWWVVFTMGLRASMKTGSFVNDNLRQTALYTNDQEYFSFGGKTSYEWESKWGVNFAIHGAFSGHYVAHIPTMSVGVFRKW